MSISGAMNNAISGLSANSRMAEIVSSNLANALTEGYGRRDVQLQSAPLGGVRVAGINRNVNPVVLSERRLADSALAGSERQASALAQIEQTLGSVDDPYSLAARLTAFEQALVSASADPSSNQRLETVVSRLGDLTGALGDGTSKVQSLRQEADANIARDVDDLNSALKQVAKLNNDIAHARGGGLDTGPLEDARQIAIDKIASIVPVNEIQRSGGAIALYTTKGTALVDGPPTEFEFTPTPTIVADMEYANGVLGGISIKGAPLQPNTGFGRLTGGSLEASFKLRDDTLVSAQKGLDELAADLITRFEQSTTDPTLGPTDTGLLTDNGSKFDVNDLSGLAGRIEVNASVDPANGGEVWRLREGVAAIAQGPVGDSSQLNRFVTALKSPHSYDPMQMGRSALGQFSQFGSELSSARIDAEENVAFDSARWNLLKEAELADGVDSDQELQKLLLIEQSYAANARLIQTASSMLQTLMEI